MYRKTMQSGESRWRNRPMQSGSSTTVPHLPGRSHVASLRRFQAGIYVRSSTCRSRSSPSLVLFHSFSSTHPFLSSHPFRLRFNLLSSFSVFPLSLLFAPFHSLCTSRVLFFLFPFPRPPSFLFSFFSFSFWFVRFFVRFLLSVCVGEIGAWRVVWRKRVTDDRQADRQQDITR